MYKKDSKIKNHGSTVANNIGLNSISKPSVVLTTNFKEIQLKSSVTNTGQTYSWGPKKKNKTIVGHTMEAYIDPDDKLTGESANINTDQTEMMQWIKSHHDIKAAAAVKGHLLNDNLGGKALNVNLFPITKAANAVHLRTAENTAKNTVWGDEQGIYYKVIANIGNPDTFEYVINKWDPEKQKKGSLIDANTIYSDLGSPYDMETANQDEIDLVKAEMTNAEAVKGKYANHPATNVGHLTETWQDLREKSGEISGLSYTSNDKETKYI